MSAVKSPGLVPGAPLLPQVNLLPPEIRASRGLRTVKRVLAIALVGVVAVVALAYGAVTLQRTSAESDLASAQNETARILVAQKEYAQVPTVLSALDSATTARKVGTTGEVLWAPLLDAAILQAPAGVIFSNVDVTGQSPLVAFAQSADPLDALQIASITFSGSALTLPDVTAWSDRLNAIPGFQDAVVVSSAITEGTEGVLTGTTYYKVDGTVRVSDAALSNRFATQEGGK